MSTHIFQKLISLFLNFDFDFSFRVGRFFNVVTVLARFVFFFSGKKCPRVLYMHDMIMTFYLGKLYRLKYLLEKNYGNLTLLRGYIVPWCPIIMGFLWSVRKWGFFQEKNIPLVSAVNYKQNSQNTNTFCFSFISSNNVEIWLWKEFWKV